MVRNFTKNICCYLKRKEMKNDLRSWLTIEKKFVKKFRSKFLIQNVGYSLVVFSSTDTFEIVEFVSISIGKCFKESKANRRYMKYLKNYILQSARRKKNDTKDDTVLCCCRKCDCLHIQQGSAETKKQDKFCRLFWLTLTRHDMYQWYGKCYVRYIKIFQVSCHLFAKWWEEKNF